jgi:hypothetical protein
MKTTGVEKNAESTRGLSLRAGEWVEVRSKEEILATLDKKGRLDELPFMPQMFAYCGQRLRVFKRAHKTCDTVNDYVGRRMKDAVHLEGIRCDGQAYGGCHAGCLIFWKEAWLKRVSGSAPRSAGSQLRETVSAARDSASEQCTELDVIAGTKKSAELGRASQAFVCQATQLPAATEPLPWWEWTQYLEDLTSGNVDVGRMARGFFYMFYHYRIVTFRYRFAPFLRWLYDWFQSVRGGIPYPRRHGTIPAGQPTPTLNLNLQPGEWVRVKSYEAILATCDASGKNRGLQFDAEMVPYCGGTYRVLRLATRIVNEKTGEIQGLKNPCIILDGVVCQSRFSECRLFCPRSIYSFWREIWLERVPGGEPQGESSAERLAASTNSKKV